MKPEITINFELLRYFDDKERVRQIRDRLQLLLIEYLS